MKRTALFLFGLSLASPALATGGYECRPVSGTGPTLIMTVGYTASSAVVSVTLRDGKRSLSTHGPRAPLAIGQSWIDSRYLWLDLTDRNLTRHEAKLRARFLPDRRARPSTATGTFSRNGRTWQVRCVEA